MVSIDTQSPGDLAGIICLCPCLPLDLQALLVIEPSKQALHFGILAFNSRFGSTPKADKTRSLLNGRCLSRRCHRMSSPWSESASKATFWSLLASSFWFTSLSMSILSLTSSSLPLSFNSLSSSLLGFAKGSQD